MSPRDRRDPGDWMLHPLALFALLALALNDHLLKSIAPSWFTGKLSDVAGLLFFPLFLLSVTEVLVHLVAKRALRSERRLCLLYCLATSAVFVAINLSHEFGLMFLRFVTWVGEWLGPLLPGRPSHTVDPSDLFALPVLLVPLGLVWTRTGESAHATPGARHRRSA